MKFYKFENINNIYSILFSPIVIKLKINSYK